MIFGSRASNTSQLQTDIPQIVNGVLIVAAAANVGLNLPFNGQLVTPNVNLRPSALTPNTPQVELAPGGGVGSLQGMAQSGNLVQANADVLQVYASIVPDMIQARSALGGDNTIVVGNGNDVVFGNYGVIGALPTTGLAPIDKELEGLSATMLGVLTQFSALSTAEDALQTAQGDASAYLVEFGNSKIAVGGGQDTVFGNEGEYLVPGVALTPSSGSLTTTAQAFDQFVLDAQEAFADLSYVAHEAGAGAIAEYASVTGFSGAFNPAASLRGATHLLDFDNSNITGGSGADLIVGGNGYFIMPGAGVAIGDWAAGADTATLTSLDAALAQQQSDFTATIDAQFAVNHPFVAGDSDAAKHLFNGGLGFNIETGDNVIAGGSGDSVIAGGTALILDPVFGSGLAASLSTAALQSTMSTAIDQLFLGTISAPVAAAYDWGAAAGLAAAADWSSAGGYVFNGANSSVAIDSETISTGSGADHVYAGLMTILPLLGDWTGIGTSFYGYPTAMAGTTSTSNYNYAYGFGPFGALQPWQSGETAPAKFTVDQNTLTAGSGTDVMFGSLGNDTFYAGSGADSIAGGWGFNTIYAGSGADTIEFNRSTDTLVPGTGAATAASSLDTSAGSPLLAFTYSSPVTATLAAGLEATGPALLKTGGVSQTPRVFAPAYVAPQTQPVPAPTVAYGGPVASLNSPIFGSMGPPALTFAANPTFAGFVSLPASSVPLTPADFEETAPDDANASFAADDAVFAAYSLGDTDAKSLIARATDDEVIRAIPDDDDLAVVATDDVGADEPLVWVFDEERGVFFAREAAPLVILADSESMRHDDAYALPGAASATPLDGGAGGDKIGWTDALRRFGQKTARLWFDA